MTIPESPYTKVVITASRAFFENSNMHHPPILE